MDCLSSLPTEISNIIFMNNLDDNSRFSCLEVNVKIRNLISKPWLENLKICCKNEKRPHKLVIEFYERYCNYFKVFLKNNELSDCNTVVKAKKVIDNRLLSPLETDNSIRVIDKITLDYINRINSDAFKKDYSYIKNIYLTLIDDMIQIRLVANANPFNFLDGKTAKLKWCSEKTIELLVDKCFENLPMVRANDWSLCIKKLMLNIPSKYKHVVEKKIFKFHDLSNISRGTVKTAFLLEYSKGVIRRLLSKVPEDAVRNNPQLKDQECISNFLNYNYFYSDHILDCFFEENSEKITNNHLLSAIQNSCSMEIFEELFLKLDSKEKICSKVFNYAVMHNISKIYLKYLLFKVNESEEKLCYYIYFTRNKPNNYEAKVIDYAAFCSYKKERI